MSLVVRLRDRNDAEAWDQFIDIYAPLIYGLARKRGLQDADAADLTQDVLRIVAASACRLEYGGGKSTFRGWLFTVVRNKLHDFFGRGRRAGCITGNAQAEELASQQAAADDFDTWSRDYEQQLFACACEVVRPSVETTTWQAFWQSAVEGKPGKTVAEELGMSVASVYVAKSRVLARLRKQIAEWADESIDQTR
jgi:RNA polymerase sigma factor (sigma-70 family)